MITSKDVSYEMWNECHEPTCCFDETLIMLFGKQGIWQVSEELLQQASNAIHIVVEVLWVAKIHLIGICTVSVSSSIKSAMGLAKFEPYRCQTWPGVSQHGQLNQKACIFPLPPGRRDRRPAGTDRPPEGLQIHLA